MVTSPVTGALETVPKGFETSLEDLEIGGRTEIILIAAMLWSARTLRRVLETWGDLLSRRLQWKTINLDQRPSQ